MGVAPQGALPPPAAAQHCLAAEAGTGIPIPENIELNWIQDNISVQYGEYWTEIYTIKILKHKLVLSIYISWFIVNFFFKIKNKDSMNR